MAFRYDIRPNTPDSHQSDPWWFAVIVRFKHVRTFDRKAIVANATSTEMNVSLYAADTGPVDEKEPLVLTNQLTAFTVSYSKSSHTCSAAFRVVPGAFHFEGQTHAGDWLLFWAFDNYSDYQRVLSKAINALQKTSGDGANGFLDGLKFVGRLNAPKLDIGVDPGTGVPRKEYTLTAVGFGEMDAKVYFNESHQAKYQELIGGYVAQVSDLIGADVSKVDEVISGGLPLTTKQHVSTWLETFLGSGPGAASKGFDKSLVAGEAFEQEVTNSLLQTPNDIFLVPSSVGRLLGIQKESNTLRYYDLLNVFIGVQGPSSGHGSRRDAEDGFDTAVQAYEGLVPESVGEPTGTFRAQYMNFGMTPVWDLIRGFSNEPINEMFVGLRVNARGQVGPSFVLRQNPLSSIPACKSLESRGWAMTSFLDLPRWKLDTRLLLGKASLGESESLHYNYIHCQGQDLPGELPPTMVKSLQNALAPPMADMADIKRNGLRPFVAMLNADITGLIGSETGRGYTQFMADILADAHLKWSGSIPTYFVQEPIAVGDNLEFMDVIYHIEAITHSGQIDVNTGRKTASTHFSVSSGISTRSEVYGDNILPYENPANDESINYETRLTVLDKKVDIGAMLDEQDRRQLDVGSYRETTVIDHGDIRLRGSDTLT